MRRTLVAGAVLALLALALLVAAVLGWSGDEEAAQAEADVPPALLEAAGIQMTLSAIAYADDQGGLADIETAIENELNNPSYATRGGWELVWGPAAQGGNLAYIARNELSPEQHSLVIRGTDFDLLSDDIEDVWLEQGPYPYASGALRPRVSRGSLTALRHLQRMTDPRTGRSLEAFLTETAKNAPIDLAVTGHSLGGGLASLVLLWLHDVTPRWGISADNLRLSAYTFAGHTVGNADFAEYFAEAVGSDLHRFVNPLDLVPHGYGNLAAIAEHGIPTRVPLEYEAILDGLVAYLFAHGLRFQQVGSEILLEGVPLPSTLPYLRHVLEQHRPNSYLYLLGAPQLDIGEASLLPQYDR